MIGSDIRIRLNDQSLFGNDAAEDEEDEVFASYVIKREEVESFGQSRARICIARAYKGEGKSALLRLAKKEILDKAKQEPLLVHIKATSIAPSLPDGDATQWIRGWKQAILGRIASEIGAKIGFAWRDDDMSLVEEAEKQGYKSHNLVSAVLERVGISLEPSGRVAKASLSIKRTAGLANAEPVIKRWASGKEPIWFIIDDVDENFEDTPTWRLRVASFFTTCRDLITSIPQLRIRAAVRPNVWTTLKLKFEDLSKVEQYVTDLSWSEELLRKLLANRIEGYLKRNYHHDQIQSILPQKEELRDLKFISLVFEEQMQWGKHLRSPHVILSTLSMHRPRWLVELCRVAAADSVRYGRDKIAREDIISNLESFGRRRIEDTVAEFKSQCPEVEELISGFSRSKEQMATDELLKFIENKILDHLNPRISGVIGKTKNVHVARFLFEIGFIFARRDLPDGSYEHKTFSENPSLLSSRAELDAGFSWEIHPVFRQVLEIRDSSGTESKREPRSRTQRR
jgi:hypothetical protein